ncbi:Putative membrane protein mmpS5 [Frondihabitans sp. 762G35]|uniref:MmpS family transport accessory protein n=1 Tax=Frondihabitans sp. 762G35 TaxID=1446794 RepID=UPI000D228B66|nr:MmpS family transport accessory protein [Frondihabitans sp. 762G35]ARC55962.1 Putative membrane protein mmpS5 [Frondihabitans sp. 762G35]
MKKLHVSAALILAALALTGCSSTTTTGAAPADTTAAKTQSSAPAKAATTRSVTYEVTGDGTKAMNVTYLTFNGGGSSQAQATSAPLPFKKVIPIKSDQLFESSIFSLVAQADDGTKISCKITVDGKVIQEQTSTGQYSVVTCSGSASK